MEDEVLTGSTAGRPQRLMAWMECLSDGTRLRICRLLERGELGVVELCEVLQMPQSTVSRHLKTLAAHGFVGSRRQGTTNLYRMAVDELDAPARKLWILSREQLASWPTAQQDEMRLIERLRQREAESQRFFANAAEQWDKLRSELYGDRFSFQAMLGLLPMDQTIADLGCGTGQISAELAGCVKQVIAVDNSPAMLDAFRRRVGPMDNVDLREGDLAALPVDDGACDGALLVLALSYAESPRAVLGEMARILKPGGRAVVVDLLNHDNDDFRRQMGQRCCGFEPDAVRGLLGDAGLVEVNVRSLTPVASAKGPAMFVASGRK